jgi:dihydrodipicolinate synthase/N-acetylneuraminate lyase
MRMMGMIGNELRLPLCEMAAANEAKLEKVMMDYELLKRAR